MNTQKIRILQKNNTFKNTCHLANNRHELITNLFQYYFIVKFKNSWTQNDHFKDDIYPDFYMLLGYFSPGTGYL